MLRHSLSVVESDHQDHPSGLVADRRDSARYLLIKMNSPSLSSLAAGAESNGELPDDCRDNDAESDGDAHSDSVTIRQDVSSTGWMFNGSVAIDFSSNTADFTPQDLHNSFKAAVRTTPVILEHMIIFADLRNSQNNRVFLTSIRGYAFGKLTSKSKWEAWLQSTSWTPLSNVGVSDEYKADILQAEDPTSSWFILGKYGSRDRFRVRSRAFYYVDHLEIYIQDSLGCEDGEASWTLQLVREKLMKTVDIDSFLSKGAHFVLAQCNVQQLAEASPGSTVRVPIQVFLQSKQTDVSTWQRQASETAIWNIAPGGLCGLGEFIGATSDSCPWTTIYQFGELKKNNNGRMTDKQASGLSRPPRELQRLRAHKIRLLNFVCSSARALAIRLFVHQLALLIH